MLNKYIAIGNLTQDPSSKAFDSGNSVCNFSLAINSPQGNPFYIDVQAWNKNAEKCQKFLNKGDKVFIEGRLKTNLWTSTSGEKRSKTYCSADLIHFLSGNMTSAPHNINTDSPIENTDSPIENAENISDEELDQIPF